MRDLHKHGFVQGSLDIGGLRVHGMQDVSTQKTDSSWEAGKVQIPTFNMSKLVKNSWNKPVWAGATAPELLLGEESELTTATDVWNMGVILHMLLVGEPPLN